MKCKVVNVVAVAKLSIDYRIDLIRVVRKLIEAEYNPERFPGAIIRSDKPKCTILLFTTGKMVITGLKNENDAKKCLDHMMKILRKTGIKPENVTLDIVNLVVSSHLDYTVDLDMAVMVMDNTIYEPEVFPGLIYRMVEPKCTFLVFASGSLICAGTKSQDDAFRALNLLKKEFDERGVQNVSLTEKDDFM